MLWGQAVVVLALVLPIMEVEMVLGPWAVTGAVGRAVGHHARLQAAVTPHGSVQVKPGDQRFSDADAFVPVDTVVVHGCEGSLKTHSEDQLLLWQAGIKKKFLMQNKRRINCVRLALKYCSISN